MMSEGSTTSLMMNRSVYERRRPMQRTNTVYQPIVAEGDACAGGACDCPQDYPLAPLEDDLADAEFIQLVLKTT